MQHDPVKCAVSFSLGIGTATGARQLADGVGSSWQAPGGCTLGRKEAPAQSSQ